MTTAVLPTVAELIAAAYTADYLYWLAAGDAALTTDPESASDYYALADASLALASL